MNGCERNFVECTCRILTARPAWYVTDKVKWYKAFDRAPLCERSGMALVMLAAADSSVCSWHTGTVFKWSKLELYGFRQQLAQGLLVFCQLCCIYYSQGNIPVEGVNWELGWRIFVFYTSVSQKQCETRPRFLLITNRKPHTAFRILPTSVTLNDFEPHCVIVKTYFSKL